MDVVAVSCGSARQKEPDMSALGYGLLTRSRERTDPHAKAVIRADFDDLRQTIIAARGDIQSITPALDRVRADAEAAAEIPATGSIANVVDGLAAVVPAEALAFYTLALGWAVTATGAEAERTITVASDLSAWLLIGLSALLSVILFVIGKGFANWERLDFVRMVIPPTATLLWLTFQEPSLPVLLLSPELKGPFQIVAAFLAVVLIVLATALSVKKENEPAQR
jgi:hypothetical protein